MVNVAEKKWIINVFKAVSATVSIVVIVAVLAFFCWMQFPIFSQGKPVPFEITQCNTVKNVAKQLVDQGVPINDTLFILMTRLFGGSSSLRAGAYELEAGETPSRLLQKMTKGIYAMESLTVIEGWKFGQMRQAIAKHPGLKHETMDLSDEELLKKLEIDFPSGEGLFFPDTYLFKKGTPDMDIYQQAYRVMMDKLSTYWENRDPELPYKEPYDVLIMASIVEKETGHPDDRDMISGVFVNRLRIGMKLQADPTVIYGMGNKYKGKIRTIDLRTDTPYNTYTRYGLPPTPIALPGREALKATFYPAKTNAFYFVARGDGTSHFSCTLDEHNKAVNKYIIR